MIFAARIMMRFGLTGAICAMSLGAVAYAQTAEEVRKDRRENLRAMLNGDDDALIPQMRSSCASGTQLQGIEKGRATGWKSLPDASDYCAVALDRSVKNQQLLSFYRTLLITATGSATDYDKLPSAIAASVMQRRSYQVALGNGKAATVTPALAWDSGFTVAHQQRPAKPNTIPEVATLKPVAERCLGQQESDLSLCYSIGYLYGIRAIYGLPITAPQ